MATPILTCEMIVQLQLHADWGNIHQLSRKKKATFLREIHPAMGNGVKEKVFFGVVNCAMKSQEEVEQFTRFAFSASHPQMNEIFRFYLEKYWTNLLEWDGVVQMVEQNNQWNFQVLLDEVRLEVQRLKDLEIIAAARVAHAPLMQAIVGAIVVRYNELVLEAQRLEDLEIAAQRLEDLEVVGPLEADVPLVQVNGVANDVHNNELVLEARRPEVLEVVGPLEADVPLVQANGVANAVHNNELVLEARRLEVLEVVGPLEGDVPLVQANDGANVVHNNELVLEAQRPEDLEVAAPLEADVPLVQVNGVANAVHNNELVLEARLLEDLEVAAPLEADVPLVQVNGVANVIHNNELVLEARRPEDLEVAAPLEADVPLVQVNGVANAVHNNELVLEARLLEDLEVAAPLEADVPLVQVNGVANAVHNNELVLEARRLEVLEVVGPLEGDVFLVQVNAGANAVHDNELLLEAGRNEHEEMEAGANLAAYEDHDWDDLVGDVLEDEMEAGAALAAGEDEDDGDNGAPHAFLMFLLLILAAFAFVIGNPGPTFVQVPGPFPDLSNTLAHSKWDAEEATSLVRAYGYMPPAVLMEVSLDFDDDYFGELIDLDGVVPIQPIFTSAPASNLTSSLKSAPTGGPDQTFNPTSALTSGTTKGRIYRPSPGAIPGPPTETPAGFAPGPTAKQIQQSTSLVPANGCMPAHQPPVLESLDFGDDAGELIDLDAPSPFTTQEPIHTSFLSMIHSWIMLVPALPTRESICTAVLAMIHSLIMLAPALPTQELMYTSVLAMIHSLIMLAPAIRSQEPIRTFSLPMVYSSIMLAVAVAVSVALFRRLFRRRNPPDDPPPRGFHRSDSGEHFFATNPGDPDRPVILDNPNNNPKIATPPGYRRAWNRFFRILDLPPGWAWVDGQVVQVPP